LAHASDVHMHLSDHGLACPLHQPSHFAIGCGVHSAQPEQAPEVHAHLDLHDVLYPWHQKAQPLDAVTIDKLRAKMRAIILNKISRLPGSD